MSSMIKTLVSRNKRRFQDDGFDLDLTYIYPNIIAMGFPAEKLEGVYRNHVDDVLRFLDSKHKDHYRVYNLCSERKYDGVKFHNRVVLFPFEDHHPPPIELIKPFCEDLDAWLTKDRDNIAAIHCKAGKGRTGVMICAYLLHRKKFTDAEKCLDYYGKTRTRDGKGVTIPSQRRYVKYYGQLISYNLKYEQTTLLLTGVKFKSIPHLNSGSCNVIFDVFCQTARLGTSPLFEGCPTKDKEKDRELPMTLPKSIVVCGDICVDFFHKPPRIGKKERIFQCWFNTYFVLMDAKRRNPNDKKPHYLTLEMTRPELDKANKDKSNKIYKPDFKVVFTFEVADEQPDSNGTVTVNRSLTADALCSKSTYGVERNGASHMQGARYEKNRTFPICGFSGPVNPQSVSTNTQNVTQQVDRMHLSSDSDSVGGRQGGFPTSSQSVPEFNKTIGEMDVQKRLHVSRNKQDRQGKLSPSVGRRENMLLPVQSDNSLVSLDNTSTGDGETEDFSDTDTDDEWAGCEVTAV